MFKTNSVHGSVRFGLLELFSKTGHYWNSGKQNSGILGLANFCASYSIIKLYFCGFTVGEVSTQKQMLPKFW